METSDFIALRRRSLALIERHYRDSRVGPEWIASQLFVSRRQLDRAFANRSSVAEVLARRRLRHVVAIAALNPKIPMSEIAIRSGYRTYETFRAQCHKYLGCTPRVARSSRNRALSAAGELPTRLDAPVEGER